MKRRRLGTGVLLPFLVSRLIVWVSGVVAMLVAHEGRVFDPPGVTARLGHTANVLLAPALRWDAVWYVTIARHGYRSAANASFFPLYPLAMRGLSYLTQSVIAAGIIISMAAGLAALYVVYRLVELDFGPGAASAATWLVALFPMSFFLSAIYTEPLFLALSAASVLCARRGQWARAGMLGALASATRSIGLVLVLALVVIYARQHRSAGRAIAREAVWIALVPLGLAAYMVGLGIDRGTPFAMLRGAPAQRGFVLAPFTVLRQVTWTAHRLGELFRAGHYGFGLLYSGLPELGFLALTAIACAGVARRLHPAYGAYVIAAAFVLLCEPQIHGKPLTSFPRYMLVLFPLWVWLANAAHERGVIKWLLGLSTLLLILFTGQFATWHFVA